MWRIEKRRSVGVKRYEWEVGFSSHGLAYGYAFTRRRAERKLWNAQAWLLSEEPPVHAATVAPPEGETT